MLHLAILLEEGDLVDRGFDPQDQAEFIVQFDRDGAHLMLEPGTQPAPIEAVTQFALVIAMQFSSQESGNIGRFDGRDQGFQKKRVEGLQSGLTAKDQVGGEFRLPDAPVVTQVQALGYRTILRDQFIQPGVQLLDIHLLHQLVGNRIIVDMGKGIIEQLKSDSFLLQLIGQPGMPVEIEL